MPFDPETTLRIRWSKRENDVVYQYPGRKADGHLLHHYIASPRPRVGGAVDGVHFDPSLLEELEKRGYDLTTLSFSIKKKKSSDLPTSTPAKEPK